MMKSGEIENKKIFSIPVPKFVKKLVTFFLSFSGAFQDIEIENHFHFSSLTASALGFWT